MEGPMADHDLLSQARGAESLALSKPSGGHKSGFMRVILRACILFHSLEDELQLP